MPYFIGDFCNIRTVNGVGNIGYQVVMAGVQSVKIKGNDRAALRKVLETRNQLYQEMDTTHQGLLKREAYGGVNFCLSGGGGGNREKKPAWRINIRNLRTGQSAQVHFIMELHGGERAAKRKARKLVRANNDAYNEMVEDFNRQVINDSKKLAAREVKTLKPCLQKINNMRAERWENIFFQRWPVGLNDNRVPE